MSQIRTFMIGEARVSVIDIGEITLELAPAMGFAADELEASPDLRELGMQRRIPMQDVLIELGDSKVLVDAGSYDIGPDSEYAIESYRPPPGLLASLAELGVGPGEIDHLVITHRHWDHFNALASESGGTRRPVFVGARHYLGAGDWEAVGTALGDPASREARHLGVAYAHGLLEPVHAAREIVPGVTILPAPGETAGHQVLRLESRGEVFYALGDMYHHPAELSRPERMVRWADPTSNRASRARITAAALREDATLLASHIPSLGRLERVDGLPRWQAVD